VLQNSKATLLAREDGTSLCHLSLVGSMSRGKQQDFNGADVKRIKLLRTQKDSTSSGSESDDDEPSLVNRKASVS